jgi:uncharacterized protein
MKFTLDNSPGLNLIRAYSPAEIRIATRAAAGRGAAGRGPPDVAVSERVIRTSCLISAQAVVEPWEPQTLDELQPAHLAAIFELQPELVLLGTGAQQRFASFAVRAAFNQRGVGLDSMDLGAACRTFNVLVQEERRVVAALLLR